MLFTERNKYFVLFIEACKPAGTLPQPGFASHRISLQYSVLICFFATPLLREAISMVVLSSRTCFS